MAPRYLMPRLLKGDFPPLGMPHEVRGLENTWRVYNLYEIVTPLPYKPDKEDKHISALVDALLAAPEEYIKISPERGIKKTYNPFTDSPEVFLEFTKLGRNEQPPKDKIFKFVKSYGDIFAYNSSDYGADRGTSIKRFHREAKLAYNALCLYLEIIGLEKEKVRRRTFYIINNWPEVGIEEDKDPLGKCKVCEGPEGCLDCEHAPYSKFIGQMLEQGGDPNKAGSILLTLLINQRILEPENDPVCPYVSIDSEFKNGKTYPSFCALWYIPTLLHAMWLIFFLKITGKIEQEFKICPVCELPITHPRRNRIYHDGCRQIKCNREKREVLKLWKEGKPIEELTKETGLDIEQIKRWTNKVPRP